MAEKLQKLQVLLDVNGVPTGGLSFADGVSNYQFDLASETEQTMTVPENAKRAVFRFFPSGVWVAQGDDAINTPNGVPELTKAELDPIDRSVVPGATLRFITSNTVSEVNVRFFESINSIY